jgi:hypothetical protein
MTAGSASVLLRTVPIFGLAAVMIVLDSMGMVADWPLWALLPVAVAASVVPQLDILRQDNERAKGSMSRRFNTGEKVYIATQVVIITIVAIAIISIVIMRMTQP